MGHRSNQTQLDFLTPVSVIAGFGPLRVAALNSSGIFTLGDLLYWFPLRYIDRSNICPLSEIAKKKGQFVTVVGTVLKTRIEKGHSRRIRFRVELADNTGTVEVVWFAANVFIGKTIRTGMRLVLSGKVGWFGKPQMVHPLMEILKENSKLPDVKFLPLYSLSAEMRDAKIGQKLLFKSIVWVLKNLSNYPKIIPEVIEKKHGFPPLQQCLKEIHIPTDLCSIEKFRERIRYEELYQLALSLRWSKRKFSLPGRSMKVSDMAQRFSKSLPFELTDEQKKAIEVLHADALSERRMHRLLQGDVGCGKTVVAFFGCLPALNEGLQVAWLTPNELLAQQTFEVFSQWLEIFNIKPVVLKSGISYHQKQQILSGLADGTHRFVVGTHALLQPTVKFWKLGMIVIDEQHKFGVNQRTIMQEKGPTADFLLISATPIPQTLAKTLYGDLDIVSIKTKPNGKKNVATYFIEENRRCDMQRFIVSEIKERGTQVYYVVPRIEPDETDENVNIKNVTSTFHELTEGAFTNIPCGYMHGGMNAEQKDAIMLDFLKGKIKILVTTTIIEVGIDVKAANIIVIENVERFGLAQLHQLRGRVGRGQQQGYCFLLAAAASLDNTLRKKIDFFCRHHDGFEIAEMDLSLRGPGEVVGKRQSGWESLKMANMLRDSGLFREIQQELAMLLKS